jgi:hypothetical protein
MPTFGPSCKHAQKANMGESMNSNTVARTAAQIQFRRSALRTTLLLSFVIILLGGCAKVDKQSNPNQNQNADTGDTMAAQVQVPNNTPVGSPTLLPRDRHATQIARFNNERQTLAAHATSFALGTPYPTSPPLPEFPTRPAITPVPGINTDCASASKEFDFGNCWNDVVDGQYIFAQAGALKPDKLQSALRVYTLTLDLRSAVTMELYTTPSQAGKVYITSVNWPLMTLTAEDANPPVTFVFDLETRQWVTLTPGPSPSASVPPIPSVSPLPTQLP